MTPDDPSRSFELALLAMDRVRAKEALRAEAESGVPAAEAVVAAALERIGDAWENGELSLAQLYMAGRIAEQVVGELMPATRTNPGERPRLAIAVLQVEAGAEEERVARARLAAALAAFNAAPGRRHELSLAVGAAVFDPAAPLSLNELLNVADGRMYAEKRARKEARPSPRGPVGPTR